MQIINDWALYEEKKMTFQWRFTLHDLQQMCQTFYFHFFNQALLLLFYMHA